MRLTALLLSRALGLAAAGAAANAAPSIPEMGAPAASDIIKVAGGCGYGFHRHHGYCVPNRHYRPYGSYPVYPPYPYYGGYNPWYGPWNRPTPGDHVANSLNAQELGRGYWGY